MPCRRARAELQQLRRALQLAWPLVGASHLQRGLALTRGQAPAQLEAARPDDWARLRKLLFLSDCLLAEAPKRPKGTAAAAGGGGSGGSAVVRALRKVEARTDATTLLGRQARRALAALDAERRPPPGSAAAGRGAAGRAAKAAAAMLVPPPTIDEIFEALSLSPAQGKALVRETALPLYARAVQSALGRLGNNTGARRCTAAFAAAAFRPLLSPSRPYLRLPPAILRKPGSMPTSPMHSGGRERPAPPRPSAAVGRSLHHCAD